MILALAARLGCLALAVADRLKPRDAAAFDAHVADALAVVAPEPCPLTAAALTNLRDLLADWHDEVWALADVELAEMTREEGNR